MNKEIGMITFILLVIVVNFTRAKQNLNNKTTKHFNYLQKEHDPKSRKTDGLIKSNIKNLFQ